MYNVHSIYGNGFYTENITIENYKNYINNHKRELDIALAKFKVTSPVSTNELIQIINEAETFNEIETNSVIENMIRCPFTDDLSAFALVSMIMTIKYEIRFSYAFNSIPDNETKDVSAILFLLRPVWNITKEEKELTSGKFLNIINETLRELGQKEKENIHEPMLELMWSE